jgi:hypothetical protein
MKAQAFDEISRELEQVSTRRSLTRLIGGAAALGAVVIGGRGETEARKSKKSKKKAKASSPGPAGPAGATGPAGAPGAQLSLGPVSGERSAVLGAAVNSQVESVAECGLGSTPLSCGWTNIGNTSDFDRTTTEVRPSFYLDVGSCIARLYRTATVANAGGQIVAHAICTRPDRSPSS